ncbi:DUF3040 domain-containing protein [Kibdelosporangium aridum]|uniref:DUF3040 domain-containing protein n=1 Tax=Kibdelosporangium aridum TaxID=2030 RepID=A0A428YSB8_KIBAR|nr:DUF3040 domain-containing protein [Kibdelosporangium aridum]RSM72371.1 DUF3040 domain-containing protein [Kibdelosporangium aridum]
MLSAHERQELRAISQHLYADDPDLARTLSAPTSRGRRIVALLLAMLAVTLIVFGLTPAGFPLLFFGTITAMVAACLFFGTA